MAQSSQNITPATATRLAEEQVKKVLREMSGGRNSASKAALEKILKTYKGEMSKLEADIQKNEKETAAEQRNVADRLSFLQQEKGEGRLTQDAYDQAKEKIERAFAETQNKRQQEISHRRINIVAAFRSSVEALFGIDQYIAAGAELDNAAAVMQMNNLGDLAEMIRESKKANLALIEKHRKEAAKVMDSMHRNIERVFASQTSKVLEKRLEEQMKDVKEIATATQDAYIKAHDEANALGEELASKQAKLRSLKKADFDSEFQLSYGFFGSSAGRDEEDYEINGILRGDEISRLQAETSDLEKRHDAAQKVAKSYLDKNEDAEKELDGKRKKLEKLLELYNPLVERQKESRIKEQEAVAALIKLDGDLQDARGELVKLGMQLEGMRAEGNEKRAREIEKASAAAKERIAQTEKSIQDKKSELAAVRNDIKEQDKEFSGLASQFKDAGLSIQDVSGRAKIELDSTRESIQSKGSEALSKTAESVSGIKAADRVGSARGVMKQKLVAGTLDQIKNDTKLGRLLKGALAAKKGMANRGVLGAVGGLAGSIGNDIHKSIRDWKNSGGLGKKIAGGILDFSISAVRHFNANRKFKKADKTASELGLTLEQIKPAVNISGPLTKEQNLRLQEFSKFQNAVTGIRNAIEMRRQEDILNIETFGRFGMDVDGDRVEYDEKSLDAVRQQWAKQLKKGQLNTDKVYSDVPKLKRRLHKWIDAEFGKDARKNAVKEAKIANAGALGKLFNAVRAYASGSTSEEDRKKMREAAGEKIKSKGMDIGRKGLAALKNAILGKREDVVDKYADLAVVSHAKGGTWKAAMGLAKKAAGSIASGTKSGAKKVMRVLGAKKENELFSVDKKGTVTVLPSEGTGVTEVTKGSGSSPAAKGPGSLAAPKGETAQEMADRQKAAESQQNIARNVETIVRLLEEDAKLKREKKKESFWGKLLGFLGLLVGSFIPKILGMLKLLWKVGKLVGKVLKPIFKILMKVAGPLLRFLGMFGKLLAGGIAGLGKALLAGASGLFGAAKSGLKKLREKFSGKGAEAGKGKAGKAGKAGEAGKGKAKTRRLGGGRNINVRGASKLGTAGRLLGRAAGPIAALFAAKDAYDAWNDEDLHKRAFGLKEGEKASTGQKIQAGMAGAGAGIINIGSGAVGLLGAGARKLGLDGIADTLDGLAEKIRIDPATLIKAYNAPLKTLGETITNMTDGIPILGDVVKGIGGFIESSPMLKGAVEWLDQHNPLKMITEGLGKTIDWLGSDHKWEDIKAGFAGLGSWVSEKASAAWEGVKSGFASAGEWMSEKASKAWEFVKENNPISLTVKGFKNLGAKVVELAPKAWEFIKENNPVSLTVKGFKMLGAKVVEIAPKVWEFIKENNPISLVVKGMKTLGTKIVEIAPKVWEFIKENNPISLTVKGFKMLGEKIVELAPQAWEFVKEYNPVSLAVKGVKLLGEKIVELAPQAWEFIKEYNPISLTVKGLTALGEKLGEVLSKAWEGIKSGFSAAGEWMSEKASAAWEGMKGGLESAGEWMSEKASKGWEFIKEHNPFAGMIDGIGEMKDKFKDMAGEVWQSIKENNPFTAIMSGIESIRKWFDSFSLVDWVKRKFGFGEEEKKEEGQPGQPAKEEKKEERPSWLPSWIPSFGEGGIVKSTKAGTLALVAENGEDEAVMPMSKLARFVLESFKLGQEGLAGSAGGMKSVDKETFGERLVRFFKNLFGMGEGYGADGASPANKPIAGFTFELLKTVKDIRDNIELITKMVKLIKVDGITLGELVEQGTPMPAGVPGTAGPGAGTPAAGAPAAGAPSAGPGGSPAGGPGGDGGGNIQPIPGGQGGSGGIPSGGGVGDIVKVEESGKEGSMKIGYDGNGGTSYGTYQFATTKNSDSMSDFLRWAEKNGGEFGQNLARDMRAAGPMNTGSRHGAAVDVWKKYVQANPEQFRRMEKGFMAQRAYDALMHGKMVGKDQKINPQLAQMINSDRGLQEAWWSTVVQHGPHGAARVFNRAASSLQGNVNPQSLISAVYDERADVFRRNKGKKGSKLSDRERDNVIKRFGREKQTVLKLAGQQGVNMLAVDGESAKGQGQGQGKSPFTPQQQAEINANPMLQGADVKPYPSGNAGYVDIARQWAATDQGYDQGKRGAEGHFDCSSLVYRSTKAAGVKYDVPLSRFNTDSMNPDNKSSVMRNAKFQWVQGMEGMRPGDILWRKGHTVIYSGDGKIIGAHGIDKYKKSHKQQDLIDSVSERRLGKDERYRGYWRYVGDQAQPGGSAQVQAPAQAPMQQVPVQRPKPSLVPETMPLHNPQTGQPLAAPPMPAGNPAPAPMQPIPAQQPAPQVPGLGKGPAVGNLSRIYASMTDDAINRHVRYYMDKTGRTKRDSRTGRIDCSGWSIEMGQRVMANVSDPAAKKRLGHVLAGGTAAEIIDRGLELQHGKSAALDAANVKEGTMIGIAAKAPGRHGWGRKRNIGHIVTTYRDPETGKMMVSESTSLGKSQGKDGVRKTEYSEWLKRNEGRQLYGVDTGAILSGAEVSGENIPQSMQGATQTQYGVGATEQSSPQIQASQQGQAAEAAQAYYAGGGAGGQAPVDASTNIMGGGNGKQGSPIELVVNKDPMGWIRLQGNAVH